MTAQEQASEYALRNSPILHHEASEKAFVAGWEAKEKEEAVNAVSLIKGFAEYTADSWVRLHGGWVPKFANQITEPIRTTEQLLERYLDYRQSLHDALNNKDLFPDNHDNTGS